MTVHILEAMAEQGFESVVALSDKESGLAAFVGLHDTSRGPAFGGIRRHAYRDEVEALRDCFRLARAMSRKCALLELPAGGGKGVILDREGLDHEAAYYALGRFVDSLGGRFYTGPDVGTGATECGWMRSETPYVAVEGEGSGNLSEATAAGIVAGVGELLKALDGEEDWTQRRVVVQGLGGVGSRVSRTLAERGVRVLAAEIDPEKAQAAQRGAGFELIPPGTELDEICDVFVPCAMGGVVHDLSVGRLRCRALAGGANNVLSRAEHGDRLHELGILYGPDVVLNSGALLRGALYHLDGTRPPTEIIAARIAGVAQEVLQRALDTSRAPSRVAFEMAEERLRTRH